MPGGDKTGPVGMGPMTGRAAGYGTPGYAAPVAGRGMGGRGMGGRGMGGRGMGGGRGRRNRFFATGRPGWQRTGAGATVDPPQAPTMDRQQQLEALREQAAGFADALEEIRTHIEELQADTDND